MSELIQSPKRVVGYQPDLSTSMPSTEFLIADALWRTPWTSTVSVVSNFGEKLPEAFAALIPGVQPGRLEADERVLHIIGNKIYTQRPDTTVVAWPNITITTPCEVHHAIRCWVVQEPTPNGGMMVVLLLDRLLRVGTMPYILDDLSAHNTILRSIIQHLRSPDNRLQFNTVCRCSAVKMDELWAMTNTKIPHTVAGIRFETPGTSSSATDRVWLASDETAPSLPLLFDIMIHSRTPHTPDRKVLVTPGGSTHMAVAAMYTRMLQDPECGITPHGCDYVVTQSAVATAWARYK